jgi:ABC-type lipoprotein release transport system permease subunit
MAQMSLVAQSLRFYWRTNLAVIAGVAAAVTVLAGALLVGDSVRGSLRDLVLQRLGHTALIVVSSDYFREGLPAAIAADPEFTTAFGGATPLIVAQGIAADQDTGRRASQVLVYGVDERFWRFHGFDASGPPSAAGTPDEGATARAVLLSPALAREIGAAAGSTVLLRVQRPTDIPIESVHGRRDDLSRSVRLTVRAVLPADALGEFSLQPQQGGVLAAFVPLGRLQQDLSLPGRVNAILVAAGRGDAATGSALASLVRRHAALEDVGLRARVLDASQAIAIESPTAIIDDARGDAARGALSGANARAVPVFTYLVNTLRAGGREIPYSLVTATDLDLVVPDWQPEESSLPPLVLNDWAARDLSARVGDRVTLEYFVWQDPGQLATESANFRVAAVVPMTGLAGDRDLAPEYPGISTSTTLRDWDPPFPLDLGRIRPIDEDYWDRHRTTPKAFIPTSVGQALWRSRYGALTSIRVHPPAGTNLADARAQYLDRVRAAIDPLSIGGLAVQEVRAAGLSASRGATNFGEYFTYFSFFLVVSALLLASLFFKLGVEQRVREVGLLRAVGFTPPQVRRLFTIEALVLSALGSALGVLGALAYGALLMTGLRTWWVDAVGTTALSLHVSPVSLAIGALSGNVAAVVCIWWTLRTLIRISERSLLAGQLASDLWDPASAGATSAWDPASAGLADGPAKAGPHVGPEAGRPPGTWNPASARFARTMALVFAGFGALLVGAGLAGAVPQAGAFFGAGASLLIAATSGLSAWLKRPRHALLSGHGWWPVARLGFRNAGYRPGRSVAAVAVMASAVFILVSVDAFRRDGHAVLDDPRSGTGGYPLLVSTVLPVAFDPNTDEGRALFGLSGAADVSIVPFRVRPGDDASCLNLYAPTRPRILGAQPGFIAAGRFSFAGSLDRSDEERENPWLLLNREYPGNAIPVIGDANSLTYVLKLGLGDEFVLERERGAPVRLLIVAALSDSVLQSELVMSDANFRRLFPEQEGYQFFLAEVPLARADEVAAAIEDRLADFGGDVRQTSERLAEFHRVENTYLSTFQTLGGLGLLLGTVGLAAILLRNVLERRRELALLGAVGYDRGRLFGIVIAESALLLAFGLAAGVLCALLAILPAAIDRGGRLPAGAGLWLLLAAVFATGLVASVAATRAAIHARLLDALRAE